MASVHNQTKRQSKIATKRKSFWRRKPRGYVIIEGQIGHIHTEETVYVDCDGVVVGDIFAPKVVIAGIVHGTVVTLELVIEPEGHLWGDAYATATQIKPKGITRGWLHSINEEQYNLYYLREPDHKELADTHSNGHLSTKLQSAVDDLANAMPPNRADILAQLRDEAAVAISSRLELESTFNKRVAELSGANLSEAERLRERVTLINNEHTSLQQRLAELHQKLQGKNSAIQQLEQELADKTNSLKEAKTRQDALKDKHYQQNHEIDNLHATTRQLQIDLSETKEQVELLNNRNSSLETTLQSSLQRTAEQEDALLRWQELAELNEGRAREAEESVEIAKLDAQEYSQSLEMIKGQRDQIEKEWEAAYQEVQGLRAELKKKSDTTDQEKATKRIAELTKKLENKNQELAITRQTMVDTTGAYSQAKQEINLLQHEVAQAKENTAQTSKLNEALQKEVEERRDQTQKLETELKNAQMQSAEDSAIAKAHQTALARIAELETLTYRLEQSEQKALVELIEMENKLATLQTTGSTGDEDKQQLQAEISKLKGQLADSQVAAQEVATLRQNIRFNERRISDAEEDIEVYQQQLQAQGSRLAETQSELIEKQIQLNELLDKAKEQAVELNKIKRLAGKRIQRLETELVGKRTQIEDLMKLLERRERRQ